MLLSKTVKVKWNSRNKNWYEDRGYIYTKMKDEFEVKVEDLTDRGKALVNVKCDCLDCKSPYLEPMFWQNYKRNVHESGKYYCGKCATELFAREKMKQTKLLNSESFYDWCYRNLSKKQADDIMLRWDKEKNRCNPKDIAFSSHGFNGKGYWFKCLDHPEHESELKSINDFTNGHDGVMDCNQCNSFAQYLIDTYGENALNSYWDYSKNIDKNGNLINPWKIPKGGNYRVWIFCQIHKYHGSYDVLCSSFYSQGSRCSFCTNRNGKVHLLDSLGYLYPEVIPIWSEKNKKTPYDYSPFSSKSVYWKCLDGKHKDYKRSIRDSNYKDFRCSSCVQEMDESVIQNKTRVYLESLGYDVIHEHNCTIVPINPKTKHTLPFDNEIILINNKHLICEVNGIQHYEELSEDSRWLNGTTPKKYLHYQRLKDRYKRFISYKNKYEYLELPYWTFDKDDTYKKLINNKINQIINKL